MNWKTYIISVIGIFIAKALGFGRNIFFASAFGATELTDIYFQIFSIPTFLFTGIGTALSTLIIKNLNKKQIKNNFDKVYASQFIIKTCLIVLVITFFLYLFAGSTIKLLLPGINPDLYIVAQNMMYIMLPSALFIIVAYIISGILQNNKIYFITSIMSLPYNIIIILALLFKNIDIYTICWITTLGWFLHIVILLPNFYRKGYRFFYKSNNLIKTTHNKTKLEVFYIFISSMMFQMCFIYDKAAVSHEIGAATIISYATNFFITIVSVFIVAMSNVSYPSICKNYELNNKEKIKISMGQSVLTLFVIIVPFLIINCMYGENIMCLLYERDQFTHELTNKTALLYKIYSFGVFGYICQEFFNKILYLDYKYIVPLLGSIVIMLVKPIINLHLSSYGLVWIAISTTLLVTIYSITIFWRSFKVTGNYFTKDIIYKILKILFSGFIAFLATHIIGLSDFAILQNRYSFLILIINFLSIYLLIIYLSGCVNYLITNLKKKG